MIIDNIEIEFVKIKLTRPYTIAYKTTSSINNIFIKIILNNGIVGLGSSSVSKYVVGLDTKQSYENAINFKNELIGKNISYFLHNIDIIEKEFDNDPGSKAAYNIALYDAFCKSLNISLGSFLGRIIPELPTSITVGIKDINETIPKEPIIKSSISLRINFHKTSNFVNFSNIFWSIIKYLPICSMNLIIRKYYYSKVIFKFCKP